MRAPAIVVVGSYMRDTVLHVPRLPRPGDTVATSHMAFGHGGKGSNQAVQAARLGARVALVGAVGNDPPGNAARELWTAEEIGHRGVSTLADESTGAAFVVVDDHGENQIVIAPGANGRLSPAAVAERAGDIARAAGVLAQLETPFEATVRAFDLGRRAGAVTVLNAAPLASGLPLAAVLALTDLVVCNLGEARALLGDEEPDPGQLAARLAGRFQCGALVTAGSQGAWLRPRAEDATLHQPAITARRVIDTTGAGDAFIGAFLCRWLETRDWRQALRFGAAAGAMACETPGAVTALGTRAAVEQRLNG
jgi:ribokinase